MLRIYVTNQPDKVILRFEGDLDETSTNLSDTPLDPKKELHLNLEKLVKINSVGIRYFQAWVNHTGCSCIRLYQCPKIFVVQLNMVKDFLPATAIVESFYAPFFSEISGEETQVLFTRGKEFNVDEEGLSLKTPTLKDHDGNEMLLDVQERYFRFLEYYPRQ